MNNNKNMKTEDEENFPHSFLLNINFIHEVKIFNEIQNNKKILIFDFRTKEDYNRTSLYYSINIPYNEHDKNNLKVFNVDKMMELASKEEIKEMVRKYKRYYIVIIMSEKKIARKKILKHENSEDIERDIIIKTLLFYKALVNNRVRELGLFNLGFSKFVDHYEFIVCKNSSYPLAKYILNLLFDLTFIIILEI